MDKIEYIKMFKLEDSHFWFLGKRYFVDSLLMPVRKNISKILDLGSGTGGITKHLEKYGKVTGVEEYYYAVKLARKRKLDIINGNINKLNITGKYDLVTIFDVLYHRDILDENQIIKKVYGLLNKKGLILITDSALNILKSKHDEAVQGKRRYNLKTMEKLLKDNGFKVIKSSYIYFFTFPVVLINRLIFTRFSKSTGSDVDNVNPLINKLFLVILKIESLLLKFISFPIGSSVILLARKI